MRLIVAQEVCRVAAGAHFGELSGAAQPPRKNAAASQVNAPVFTNRMRQLELSPDIA